MMKNQTAGIILAAGMSVRFGSPKLLVSIQNKTLLQRTVQACLNSELDRIVVVLGHHYPAIAAHLESIFSLSKFDIVINPKYDEGKSQSIQFGLKSVMGDYSSVMFIVADQPFITPDIINRMLDRFRNSDKDICVPVANGKQRNPTIFKHTMYAELLTVTGDSGGKSIIDRYPEKVLFVEYENDLPFLDMDTTDDLNRMVALLQQSGSA